MSSGGWLALRLHSSSLPLDDFLVSTGPPTGSGFVPDRDYAGPEATASKSRCRPFNHPSRSRASQAIVRLILSRYGSTSTANAGCFRTRSKRANAPAHVGSLRTAPRPCLRAPRAPTSPNLGERAHLDVERPCRAFLVGDVPGFLGDCGWLDEERVSRRLGSHRPGPFQIDDGIDHDVGDVHALRSDLAGDRFREYPLCRLGRRKAREPRLAAKRRRGPGDDERAFSRLY